MYSLFFSLGGIVIKNYSVVTGKTYDPVECVHLVNPLQVYKYLQNNAELLDIFCGNDNKLIYVFNRKDTYDLYDKWCKREL